MSCFRKVCFAGITGVGVVMIIMGAVLGWSLGPYVVETLVHLQLDLTDESSEGYKNFITPPVAPRMKFYFFDVDNYEALIDGTAVDGKPILVEKGPFTYREDREKKELNFTDGQKYLAFGQYKNYVFLPEESCEGCTEESEVRIINVPAASFIAKAARDVNSAMNFAFPKMNEMFNNGGDELFKKVKVADFLFRGINDGVVRLLMNDTSLSTLVTKYLPDTFQDNGFALFNKKVNTSYKECYQVSTSKVDWDHHAVLNQWGMDIDSLQPDLSHAKPYNTNGDPVPGSRGWWPYSDAEGKRGENSSCNALRGTDGAQFPPYVSEDDILWVFNTLPCRSLYFQFEEKVEIEGISVLEFGVPLEGGNVNRKENVCTCEPLSEEVAKYLDPETTETSCVQESDDPDTFDLSNCDTSDWRCYDGIMDISNCQGSPLYLSFPHYYLADDQQANFAGLSPNIDEHRTYLDVEPYTGVTLRIHNRIQLNTVLYNFTSLGWEPPSYLPPAEFKVLENLKYFSTFPFVWLDLTASIDNNEDELKKLKSELVTPLLLMDIFTWVLIGVGIAVTLLGAVLFICKRN